MKLYDIFGGGGDFVPIDTASHVILLRWNSNAFVINCFILFFPETFCSIYVNGEQFA